ncbi:DUF1834 family protein [Neisseriaceae bacterium TC5R-5]|nr:DUF1834 family protein [Neisseriaceae bacterium TC5R-5]
MSLLIQLQDAMSDRLRQGLGRMAREVAADLDETTVCGMDLKQGNYQSRITPAEASPGLNVQVLARLPAAWVVAGGITSCLPATSQRQRYKAYARYTVIVGDRLHVDSQYQGAGCWNMVYAVRRLLAAQDFGLPVFPLIPEGVRPLGQALRDGKPWSVIACDFSTHWLDDALENGHWPAPQNETDIDALFKRFDGRLEGPAQDWLSTKLSYSLDDKPQIKAEDEVHTRPV